MVEHTGNVPFRERFEMKVAEGAKEALKFWKKLSWELLKLQPFQHLLVEPRLVYRIGVEFFMQHLQTC